MSDLHTTIYLGYVLEDQAHEYACTQCSYRIQVKADSINILNHGDLRAKHKGNGENLIFAETKDMDWLSPFKKIMPERF